MEILSAIQSVVPHFSIEHLEILKTIANVKKVRKNTDILPIGGRCNFLWFIQKGAVKAFHFKEEHERCLYFFTQGLFFTNYYCWVTGNQSDLCFRSVTECEIMEISYPKLETLCTAYHIFDTIGRKFAEKMFVEEYQLRRLLTSSTAMDRYLYIEQNRPEIFAHFSLKDIASFIGITDSSLSRIRRNRSKR